MDLQSQSRFFRWWAGLVLRFKWLTALVLVLITAVAATSVQQKLRIETSPEYFAKGSSDAFDNLQAFRDEFGRDDQYLVLVTGDVFTKDFLTRLVSLHRALETADISIDVSVDDAADDGQNAGTAGVPPADMADQAAADDGWGTGTGTGEDADDGWDAGAGGAQDWEGSPASSVIEDVVSLVNFRRTVSAGGGLRVVGLMDDFPTDLPAFKVAVLGDDTIVGSVLGADGHSTVLAVRTAVVSDEVSQEILAGLDEIVAQHQGPDFHAEVTGLPSLEHAISSTLISDMRVLISVAFALMAVVLWVLFRHPVAVVAPLLVVGTSIVWTLGTMAALGTPVTLITNIIPAFLICVGLGDSVHIQSVVRDLRARGLDRDEAILSAVGSTGMPVLFTTLTTMVGLLSFLTASTQGIQELGSVGAFGVFCALMLSVTIIPLLAGFIGSAPQVAGDSETRKRDWVDGLLERCTALSETVRGRRRVYVAAAAVAVLAAVGISRVQVFHDPLTWLPSDDPTPRSVRALDEDIGGISNVSVVIDAPGELGVKDRDVLVAMDHLDAKVRAFTHPRTGQHIVGNSTSLVGIVKEVNRALHDDDPAAYVLPADQRGVSDALLLFESAGADQLHRVVTTDLKKTHISFRLDWMDATSLLPLAVYLQDSIDECFGDLIAQGRVRVTVTGSAYSLVSTVGTLLLDMIRSFGVAVAIIAVMMALLLRSVRLAAVSLLPNVLPVGLVLGFMGMAGIPIDLATLLIASIVIGIAVDATIHYLHQFRVSMIQDQDVELAIRHALEHAGRAIVGTSIILSIGFGAYLASKLLNIQRFGVLVAAACTFALLSNLILVPALLRTVYGGTRAPR